VVADKIILKVRNVINGWADEEAKEAMATTHTTGTSKTAAAAAAAATTSVARSYGKTFCFFFIHGI
jgi:hypothetical protein